MLRARKRYSGAPKLDVIAPQNGSVKREQLHDDGWRSYRTDFPTVSILLFPFLSLFTQVFDSMPHFSLSLSPLFYLSSSRVYMRNRVEKQRCGINFSTSILFSSALRRVKVFRELSILSFLSSAIAVMKEETRIRFSLFVKGK